ncbi:hypothetical protein [Denitrobaculum tricleocarpae]|uniref:Uncharacterized protein n=1 Tax=Denitrobaculum tricleocarpae TaxID=2591009 RepID=A0A545TX11_9PROT|nr:hypothetical protein [Denitrobaculum tricleocarpae]TQV81758.1 hypothetical protein FKG95_05805 [Denitrobaculum tricleocarpae]
MTWILLAIPVSAVLLPTCLLLLVLMLPTMVAFIVDGTPGRKFVITVGMMNLAGTVPAVVDLWGHGQTFQASFEGMSNVFAWAGALMASGVGWLIYWVMPPIIANYQGIASRAQVLSLRAKQKKLIAAWGDEVAAVVAEPYRQGDEPAEEAPEPES